MKKTSSRLISLITAFMLVISLAALLPEGWLMTAEAAEMITGTYKDPRTKNKYSFMYEAGSDTCTITGITLNDTTATSVTIPSTVLASDGTKTVTEIKGTKENNKAYSIFGGNNDTITSVKLPSELLTIGDYTFANCSALKTVSVPSTHTTDNRITTIGQYAFYYCTSLESFSIPSTVTTIGEDAFYNCDSLLSVWIPKGVETIQASTFYGCDKLNTVTFAYGSQLKSIGMRAFYGCDKITDITLPNTLESIYTYAFYDCDRLEYIVLPESVKTIDPAAFGYCSSLKAIYIPKNAKMTYSDSISNMANGAVVYGYKGTDAERCAETKGYTFVDVDELFDTLAEKATLTLKSATDKTSGKYYVTLNAPKTSGNVINDAPKRAEITITPDESLIPAGKTIAHYELSSSIEYKAYSTSYADGGTVNCGSSKFVSCKGLSSFNHNAIENIIRANVNYGSEPTITSITTTVTPVFEDAGNAYELKVAGKQVTDVNCADVFGDGVFSYDNKTKTLTINGDCDCTGSTLIINSGIDGLVINVAGTSDLSTDYSFLSAQANTTLTGSGKLTVTTKISGIAIYKDVTVTVKDTKDISITNGGLGGNGTITDNQRTSGRNNTLIFDNANIKLTNQAGGAVYCINHITLLNSKITSPEDAFVSSGKSSSIDVKKDDGKTYVASKLTIEPIPESQRGEDKGTLTFDLSSSDSDSFSGNAYVSSATAYENIKKIIGDNNNKTVDGNKLFMYVFNECYVIDVNLYGIATSDVEFYLENGITKAKRYNTYDAYGTFTYEMSAASIAEFSNAGKDYYSKLVIILPGGHVHTFRDEPTYTWSADNKSCTASVKCEGCDNTVTENATVTPVTVTSPTCTSGGFTRYTATFKNPQGTSFVTQTKTVQDIPANGHSWGTPAYVWTKGELGYVCTASRSCTAAGCTASETEGGTMSAEVSKAATCTEKGVTSYTATFTNPAFSTQHKSYDNIPVNNDHSWGKVTYTWSDDYSACTATRVCQNNANHIETETKASEYSVVTAPTTQNTGVGRYTVVFDNKAFGEKTQDITIAKEKVVWNAPTYTWTSDKTKCTAKRTAKNDSSLKEEETVTAAVVTTKEATCTEAGSKTYTATFNNKAFETKTTTSKIDPLGHKLTHFAAKAATTEAPGNIEYWYCTRCKKYFSKSDASVEITQADTIIPKLTVKRVPGDANEDNKVDVSDVLLIQQYLAGWDVKINLENADVDGVKGVSVSDVLLIQQNIAGWNVNLA